MDRKAILQEHAEPEPGPGPDTAPEPAAQPKPVLGLRRDAAEQAAPDDATVAASPRQAPPVSEPAAKRGPRPKPAAAPAAPAGKGASYSVLLTADQWAWVESEASRRGIARRYVLLSAVDKHRNAIADHFRTTVQEGENLFHWTGEPKDVEGPKVAKALRLPRTEREILQGLIEKAGGPSMSMYLRIAADIEMREQGKT